MLLEGSLDVHLGDEDTPIAPRGVGSVPGEAPLGGGLRNASLKAGADGSLALMLYEDLERLRASDRRLAAKVTTELARVTATRNCEAEVSRSTS